jgi:hypothetical protein
MRTVLVSSFKIGFYKELDINIDKNQITIKIKTCLQTIQLTDSVDLKLGYGST